MSHNRLSLTSRYTLLHKCDKPFKKRKTYYLATSVHEGNDCCLSRNTLISLASVKTITRLVLLDPVYTLALDKILSVLHRIQILVHTGSPFIRYLIVRIKSFGLCSAIFGRERVLLVSSLKITCYIALNWNLKQIRASIRPEFTRYRTNICPAPVYFRSRLQTCTDWWSKFCPYGVVPCKHKVYPHE